MSRDSLQSGAEGPWRKAIRDAADDEADEVPPVVRRIVVAVANKGDNLETKVDRLVKTGIWIASSVSAAAISLIANFIFNAI